MRVPAWQRFREQLLVALDRANPPPRDVVWDRFWQVRPDHWIHVCPCCRSDLPHYLAIRFWGERPLADLYCSRGCTEAEIVRALHHIIEQEAA
jgi:hypothetical protein